jgi:hypothetical protein
MSKREREKRRKKRRKLEKAGVDWHYQEWLDRALRKKAIAKAALTEDGSSN